MTRAEADRKMAACRRLFDSPVFGEATAARAAYGRLAARYPDLDRSQPIISMGVLDAIDLLLANDFEVVSLGDLHLVRIPGRDWEVDDRGIVELAEGLRAQLP